MNFRELLTNIIVVLSTFLLTIAVSKLDSISDAATSLEKEIQRLNSQIVEVVVVTKSQQVDIDDYKSFKDEVNRKYVDRVEFEAHRARVSDRFERIQREVDKGK